MNSISNVRVGAGLSPCVSRDRSNNEKLCWDFKANGRSFPVVMADMGLHDQATGTHTLLSHIPVFKTPATERHFL